MFYTLSETTPFMGLRGQMMLTITESFKKHYLC